MPKEWQTDATQQSHFSVAGIEGRRQGLGEEFRPLAGHAARPRDRRSTRTSARSRIRRTTGRSASTASTPTSRTTPTSLNSARRHRQDRRQDRQARVLSDADALRPGAARPGRCAEPAVVRRIRRQRRRHVRSRRPRRSPNGQKPLQWEAPYDVVADRNGEAWEVNESSDRVGRLDPRTGEIDQLSAAALRQLSPRVRGRPYPTR